MADVICDTSSLQYLHQLGLLEHLHVLAGSIVVPDAVVLELRAGLQLGVCLPKVEDFDWVEIRSPGGATVLPLIRDLGPGEAGVLALALESPGAVVLLDDRLARRVAVSFGIPVRGTLGLLLDFKRRGLVGAVTPILDELNRLHFRLSERTRNAVLRSAGEGG